MIRIHIARNHQSIGKFTPDQVAEGLQTGEFLPTDLAWREPMESWKPLSEFDDLPEVEAPALVPPALPEFVQEAARPVEPAWERRREMGGFSALLQTVQQVFSAPVGTFRDMKTTGGLAGPLGFHVLLISLTTWVSIAYQMAALKVNPEAVLGPMASQISPAQMQGSLTIFFLLTPLFVVAGAFVTASVTHVFLLAMGGGKQPFEATFRGVCYALAPASLFQLIPMCGGVIYLAVGLLLLVIAMREIHQTDTWRASVGVTFPAILCCGAFLGLYAITTAAALSQGVVK